MYQKYVTLIESVYDFQSIEATNAYFMVGVYYDEQEQYEKSLACFVKTLFLLGQLKKEETTAAADCHYNMGSVFK